MISDSDKFWTLLEKSGWLSKTKIESVRRQIEQKESIAKSPKRIAKTLLANNLLSEEQIQQLLEGRLTESAEEGLGQKPRATVRQKRKLLPLLAWSITGALFLSVVAGGIWLILRPPNQPSGQQPQGTVKPVASNVKRTEGDAGESASQAYEFVENSDALWARPVPGQAIDLEYSPSGVQAIVRIRLRDLLSHTEGQRLLRSLGPTAWPLLTSWLTKLQTTPDSVDVLNLHLLPQGTTYPQVVAVGQLAKTTSREKITGFEAKNNAAVSQLGTDSIWFPPSSETTFVFGPNEVIEEMAADNEAGATRAVLRRELEQLRRATHDTDHITILGNPNFLRDEAQDLLPNLRRRLLDGLYEFWSQEAQAVSCGLQLSEIAVAEVRMIAREDLPPRRLQGRVKKFVSELPSATSDFLGQARLDPYWQPLALRFPSMLRFLDEQTRTAIEGKQVVVNAALPAEAIHNLILATELCSVTPASATVIDVVDRSDWGIEQVLAHTTSIRFSQKSLEQAMRDVGDQIREELRGLPLPFEIEILGSDLELEGITRNQQIRDFAVNNVSLAEALTALVQKANPEQAASPSQVEQKLVWIPQAESGGVLITTRSAAQTKSLPLPTVFRSEAIR